MAPYLFTINYTSSWAAVYAGGTVDAVSFSFEDASMFPTYNVSGVAVCNGGWFIVKQYTLYYSVGCDYSFNTTADSVDLAGLSGDSTSCFGPGTTFVLAVSPEASTSTYLAPFNFVYSPNAEPYVIATSGTVDNVLFGIIWPAVVPSGQNYICEPSEYPASALGVSGSNVEVSGDGLSQYVPPSVTTWYPQCNDTSAINDLQSINPQALPNNPNTCNADLIETLILNILGAASQAYTSSIGDR